jgi:hypothetical protein
VFLSEHFSLEELTITAQRHLDNTPGDEVVEHLRALAARLEQVRALLQGKPIHINSGYRSPAVNRAVGGSPTSDHPNGWCADFICPGFGTPLDICRVISKSGVEFDQLIEEGSWVHLSASPKNRGEVLTKVAGGGYHKGLRGQ